MAGKQEIKPGVVINYKEKLDDRFVDISTQKTTTEANNYLTQFNTSLHSENKQTVESVSPYYYYSRVRPGAKSPLSVEMAQHIFKNTLEALEDALRAEIARAFSSEKYLSDFMKENMVTKSEDQSISGFKNFDSVQIDHADIDTELVDEGTTNDLTVRNRLQIPLGAPQTRKTGDIWYDANITSPGGTSGGGETTRSISVHQYSDDVSMYDGSAHVASFLADNTVNDITLDGKTIKIPKGVILGNMNGSDSINLEKNVLNNAVIFTIKDKYIEDIADSRVALALIPINNNLSAIETDILNKYGQLSGKISDNTYLIEKNDGEVRDLISLNSNAIGLASENLNNLSNRIDDESSRITGLRNRIVSLETAKTNILNRLDGIDGDDGSIAVIETRLNALDSDEATSLKNQVVTLRSSVNTLSGSISALSESLSSISEEIIEIKNTINSIHGEGTI
ncbi:MAG: hypothetical protein IKS93_06280 [Methanobrevibacter sp.]|nr:hypothetical protein [Methanobrevibacter sp.]